MHALRRLAAAVPVTVAAFVAASTAASAGIVVLPDPNDDVLSITDAWVEAGDHDADLRSVRIDHQAKNVVLTHTFDQLVPDSFTDVVVRVDTNRDGLEDHVVLWNPANGLRSVARGTLESPRGFTCSTFGTSVSLGAPGRMTLTIPRTCLGNPGWVGIQTTVMWAGYNTYGEDLYFVEMAPGNLLDDVTVFSAPAKVATSQVVSAPARPAATTKVRVLSTRSKARKVSVRVLSSRTPKGRVVMTVRGARVQAKVTSSRTLTLKVPRSVRKGTHKATFRFVPANSRAHRPSRTTARIRIS